ncbi:MAG: metal ABC transporter ATP-binding protein [Cyanobacteriota bacterium]|nr:metal ABC transporter ATP-binding protein [Cyanobacteriota bacterium]
MVEMVLEVSHLRVERGGRAVVDDVSFALAAETDTALVGPNGAGKSSLVQALLGVLPHAAGEVRLLGQRLGPGGQLPPAVRDRIAYLPQGFSLPGPIPLTVAEFVGLGWDPAGPRLSWSGGSARRGAVAQALRRTDCTDRSEHLLSELSGGELKRVLLAFCLVRPRRLLLLDEAQAGLDPLAAEHVHQLLYQLRRSEGWTVLQVSHDLEMVRRTCDGVLCLNRSLRCTGSPDHALAPTQLARLYGSGWVSYHHRHASR